MSNNNYFGAESGHYGDVPSRTLEDNDWLEGTSRSYKPLEILEDPEDVIEIGKRGLLQTYNNEQYNQRTRYMDEHEEFGEVNFGKIFNDGLGVAGHYITKPYETSGPDATNYKNGNFDQIFSRRNQGLE